MSRRSAAELIADLEGSLTIISKGALAFAHAFLARLFGEAQEPVGSPLAEHERAGALSLGNGDLPAAYGRNRLVLLVVGPREVHAYWEVTPEKLAKAGREATSSQGSPPGHAALLRRLGA